MCKTSSCEIFRGQNPNIFHLTYWNEAVTQLRTEDTQSQMLWCRRSLLWEWEKSVRLWFIVAKYWLVSWNSSEGKDESSRLFSLLAEECDYKMRIRYFWSHDSSTPDCTAVWKFSVSSWFVHSHGIWVQNPQAEVRPSILASQLGKCCKCQAIWPEVPLLVWVSVWNVPNFSRGLYDEFCLSQTA